MDPVYTLMFYDEFGSFRYKCKIFLCLLKMQLVQMSADLVLVPVYALHVLLACFFILQIVSTLVQLEHFQVQELIHVKVWCCLFE